MATAAKKVTGLNGLTPSANETIEEGAPYSVEFKIRGACPIIFHRWSCESVEAKSKAAKGSKTKKSDDIESYLYRDDDGFICLPGEYVRQSVIHAAKYAQDPRSPRKSAMDLFKAALVCNTELCSLGTKDYITDMRRVTVQKSAITRSRPMLKEWEGTFSFTVLLPEYISPQLLHDVLSNAGRLVGVADFRPTYGRFQIVHWDVLKG